jgi:hypothetical protein
VKCHERKCDRCMVPVAVWVQFVNPAGPDTVLCAGCVDGQLARDEELIEVRCAHCENLFATDPDNATFFCSLTCEQSWKAARTFDRIPF